MRKLAVSLVAVLAMNAWAWAAVTEAEIKALSGKSLLNESELPVIDAFVKEQMAAMVRANSSENLKAAVDMLVKNAKSTAPVQQAAAMYSDRYAAGVLDNFGSVFTQADNMKEAAEAAQLKISAVLVLIATENPKFIDKLIELLSNPEAEIRYWALAGLVRPGMLTYLNYANDEANTAAKQKVIDAIGAMAGQETTGLVWAKICPTARALMDMTRLAGLMETCANARVKLYEDWSVKDEYNDLLILKEMFDVLLRDSTGEGASEEQKKIGTAAAKLYSAVYYRYTMGMAFTVQENQTIMLLGSSSRDILPSLLLEGEGAFGRLTESGSQRSRFAPVIKKYSDKGGAPKEEMQTLYDSLLGPTGSVTRKYFAADQDGGAAPFSPLPSPPTALIQSALNTQNLTSSVVTVDP